MGGMPGGPGGNGGGENPFGDQNPFGGDSPFGPQGGGDDNPAAGMRRDGLGLTPLWTLYLLTLRQHLHGKRWMIIKDETKNRETMPGVFGGMSQAERQRLRLQRAA